MPQFTATDPSYKHKLEYFTNRIRKFFPLRTLAEVIYQQPEQEYQRLVNLGTVKEFLPWTGSGVPALATVPTGGALGEFYFRTDTPGTANQRIYICTVAGTTAAIGTFVALVV